jgi:4-hydroxy-tetrahydrodipicolinate synthase
MNRGLQRDLRSVAVGLLTPFDPEDTDEIRHDRLAANARWLSGEGMDLFLACANIAEYHSLSHDERIEITETAVDALDDEDCVIAGVGGSTKTALDLIGRHEANGVDGIMVMPPDHTFKHERGLVEYYHRLADATETGLLPYIRGFDASPDLIARIADHDAVAGVKYAVPDVTLFREAVRELDRDVVWMNGMAEPLAPALWHEGAEAFSAGITNFRPEIGQALFDALENEEFERAREIRDIALPYMSLRDEGGADNRYPSANSVPAVKLGLDLAGQHGGPVREPLVELTDEDRERAREFYDEIETAIANDFER